MEAQAAYEVAVRPDYGVINFEEYAMSSEGVVRQVHLIQNTMRSVMRQDEHFGTIPGTAKPSLYKPGAEKLSLVFRLRPEYEIKRSDLYNGHREYEVICTLYHIPTGQSVGQGVGSATTMEGKYRFRGGEKEGTGRPVPKEYWNLKNAGDTAGALALIGGPGFAPGKVDGEWQICSIGEKQEHDNPADYYNTILKMAKKRAHVDAILTATAASDIFTQDVEDMPEVFGAKKEKAPPKQAPLAMPQRKAPASPPPATKKEKPAPAPAAAPAPQEGLQTFTGNIMGVTSKDGESGGRKWTLYSLAASDGNTYKTFSDTYADIGNSATADGSPVRITYKTEKNGLLIVGMEVLEEREPGQDG